MAKRKKKQDGGALDDAIEPDDDEEGQQGAGQPDNEEAEQAAPASDTDDEEEDEESEKPRTARKSARGGKDQPKPRKIQHVKKSPTGARDGYSTGGLMEAKISKHQKQSAHEMARGMNKGKSSRRC